MNNNGIFNIVGSQVKQLRLQHGWDQGMLAAKLRVAGCDMSAEMLEKIETGGIQVQDWHIFFLAKIFEIPVIELFPEITPQCFYSILRFRPREETPG